MEHRETHYHTIDKVNGERHAHVDRGDLDVYLAAVGRDQVEIRACQDEWCPVVDEED